MASNEFARTDADGRTERYRNAERTLWRHYGLEPTERFIDLDSPRARVRVLDVGEGDPVFFIHGTVGPGSWASFVQEFPGFRSLLLDRPGWGGSSPVDYSKGDYTTLITSLMLGVLDALGIERATAVGHSIGDVWAFRLAQQYPSRVTKVVLLGAGPLLAEIRPPRFIKMLASPLGALITRLPLTASRARSIARDSGHGASLDDGLIPEEFIDFQVAQARETDALRHERTMVRTLLGREGWSPGLTFEDAELAPISQPALMVYGTADPVGSVEIWKRMMATLPNGHLRVIEGGGHAVWFDDPSGVAGDVRRFVAPSDETRLSDPQGQYKDRAA